MHSVDELYNSCCCFSSVLIYMCYLENGPLYNWLLCGCDRLGELYHKVG